MVGVRGFALFLQSPYGSASGESTEVTGALVAGNLLAGPASELEVNENQ